MSGVAMPGGDADLLEQLSAQLESIAEAGGNLGTSTRQTTAAIRSDAEWTGDAADAYTTFTSNLAQGAVATQAPLSRIAAALRGYAGFLRTAQQKVAAYSSAAEVAEVSGNDSGYVSLANSAAQAAEAAVSACQAAAEQAAAEVTAASGQLSDVFGSKGPVQSWLASQPADGDTLAGFPGTGDPTGSEILKTPGAELGPEILGTPGAELGPEILITLPGEFGPEILKTPGAELGPQILQTPPGELWPLINYSKSNRETAEQAAILGYPKRVPPQKAPFNSHGMPVYTNGKEYLTPDRDSHNVSDGWKIIDRRGDRTGTWNWDLTERVGD
jgi:uncharacterized protein YukE